ncbi:hypothetical protein ACC754_39400, partial [Rhizobium johnstonii]
EPAGLLHGALGLSDRAHAEILCIDLSAVAAYPGVVWVFTGKDDRATSCAIWADMRPRPRQLCAVNSVGNVVIAQDRERT